jgi:hypothetical protein
VHTSHAHALGDPGLGLLGSILAAIVTAWFLWPRRHATA